VGILFVRATDRQWYARSKGYPRTITRSSKIPYGLSSLTLWPFGKNGARHPSTSQLHDMREEHARQIFKGKHPFAFSFVNLPHHHSRLPPLEAGNSQQMGLFSTRLSLYGLSERTGPDQICMVVVQVYSYHPSACIPSIIRGCRPGSVQHFHEEFRRSNTAQSNDQIR
jgi:hypothetical protein